MIKNNTMDQKLSDLAKSALIWAATPGSSCSSSAVDPDKEAQYKTLLFRGVDVATRQGYEKYMVHLIQVHSEMRDPIQATSWVLRKEQEMQELLHYLCGTNRLG